MTASPLREIVLPEADKQPVVLDLATGELIPLPPVGPEPEKILKVFRETGKGDFLYDVDLDDRTLIFLRDVKSMPPGEETGEPSVTGHLIRNLPETITVITKEGRRYEVTILAADDKSCTLRYSQIPADRGVSGGAPVEPEKADGALELRIVPTWNELAPETVAEYRKSLAEERTPPDSRYLWFAVRAGTNLPPAAVTEMHAGKLWLLVHNTDPLIMVSSQGWRLAHADRATDQSGRPMVRLEFDSAGAERLLQLTKANNNHPLAIIVNGVVVSAPSVSSEGTGVSQALILGNFTEQEVEDLIEVLRKDINRQSAPPDAGWADLGEPIPPDANDARTLAPDVVLDGIGQDVEGKMFVSSIRDLDATVGREYRFVIRWKDGRVQEPRYRTTVDRFGRRLWEKFTFDTWYNDRQIESIRLQSRPVQEERGPAIPSPKDEITIAAGTVRPAPSMIAPPGRYAVSFDGQGDYLYIPDSESLRKPQSLVVEMWMKPQFGPGPYDHRPLWALLGKGAALGTGRVRPLGFGLAMYKDDSQPDFVFTDRCESFERGLRGVDTGWKLSEGWLHVSETFGDYIPAPGHPLVIGRFLIPSADPLSGQIAEIRVWDGTKAPDIRQYEGKALTGDEPGLVACWTFEEGGGQIAHDISPNANHARLGSSVGPDDADPTWVDLSADLL
ncbi:MAG: hypothetical protein GX448_19910 [Planctomycetes bacterium]|nr:hypothetical protein [Planctomycetota bacterium]